MARNNQTVCPGGRRSFSQGGNFLFGAGRQRKGQRDSRREDPSVGSLRQNLYFHPPVVVQSLMVSRKGVFFAFEALLVVLLVPLLILLAHSAGRSLIERELLDAQKLKFAQDVLASWDRAGRLGECSADDIPACLRLEEELSEISDRAGYSTTFNLEGETEEHGGTLRTVCASRTTVGTGPKFARVFVCVE